MKIIDNENIAFFDVDETLVHAPKKEKGTIHLKDLAIVTDPLDNDNCIQRLKNHAMIRLLKEEHARGSQVFVWSRGGYAWAAAVIKSLNLEPYVHFVMSKPLVYYDDIPIEKWLTNRVYIEYGINYKE